MHVSVRRAVLGFAKPNDCADQPPLRDTIDRHWSSLGPRSFNPCESQCYNFEQWTKTWSEIQSDDIAI